MADRPLRYGGIAQLLHWLTAAVVLAAFVLEPEEAEEAEQLGSAAVGLVQQTHQTLGLVVRVLTVLRLLWSALDLRPAPAAMPRWMLLASKALQGLLYLLLLAVPSSAVVGTWLEGHAVALPRWLARDRRPEG
jgi:cytochrome b561